MGRQITSLARVYRDKLAKQEHGWPKIWRRVVEKRWAGTGGVMVPFLGMGVESGDEIAQVTNHSGRLIDTKLDEIEAYSRSP